ncbi:MAG: ABC transporter ATP-binding protein [Treponema sp.]|nr:ABC transporter ATP-binding protein [Treponema sp.]
MDNTALSISGLTIIRNNKVLYKDFSLVVKKNAVTCLIAPSGSGKTTLLDYIANTLDDSASYAHGNMTFGENGGHPLFSFLFQEPRLIPSATVLQNVLLPLVNVMDFSQAKRRAYEFIERVELAEKINSFPDELSGGEKQRTAIARSFAFPSNFFLFDEPFQSQDLKIKLHLIAIVRQLLAAEKRTVLFVTHDAKEAVILSDRIIVMEGNPLCIIFDESDFNKGDVQLENKITSLVVHSAV